MRMWLFSLRQPPVCVVCIHTVWIGGLLRGDETALRCGAGCRCCSGANVPVDVTKKDEKRMEDRRD